MSFIKDHWIRIAYLLISIAMCATGANYFSEITGSPEKLNQFSYIGTVATLIALLIAICEIFHNIHVSKSIQRQARQYLQRAENLDRTAFSSECLCSLDEVSSYLHVENYLVALKCFQHFRRTYARFSGSVQPHGLLGKEIERVEISLQTGTHTSARAPLTKATRSEIQNGLITIKGILEEANLKRREDYVSQKD